VLVSFSEEINMHEQIRERLGKYCGHFFGTSEAHDGSPFNGELELRPLLQGQGYQLVYRAQAQDRSILHSEHSTLAPNDQGQWCLWNLNSNTPGLLCHVLSSEEMTTAGTWLLHFSYGDPSSESGFRERVSLGLHRDGGLSYTYAWGLPGEPFAERSGVKMYPTGQSKPQKA